MTDAPSSRDKILDVAEARFAQRGFSGVGLREVAQAAGLGKSSLFHHFASKGTLYLAVLDRVIARVGERVEPVFEAPGTALARLERFSDALIDELAEHPTTARLFLRGLFEDDDLPADLADEADRVERRLGRLLERVGALLRLGVEGGELRRVSIPETLQTLIGVVVYPFASGEFGEELVGGPLFSGDAVRRRKHEVREFVRWGLQSPAALRPQGEES